MPDTPIPTPAERLRDLDAVLFDLDGTLIDTVALILTSFRYATKAVLGESLPDEVMMAGVGMPLIQQMRDFSPEHADELLRVYREFNSAHHDDMVAEYPGTEEVLAHIASLGLPMGVVTSKGTPMTLRGVRRFGLERFFKVLVTADDVPLHKPDPYPLRHAAGLMGVDITRCAYLGDSPHDMAAAIAAGAVPIAALWGAFPTHEVLAPGPAFAIEHIVDLPALLADPTPFAV